jgi:hypothetical protein
MDPKRLVLVLEDEAKVYKLHACAGNDGAGLSDCQPSSAGQHF